MKIPTTASRLEVSEEEIVETVKANRPKPLSSLTASAERLTARTISRLGHSAGKQSTGWQSDGWDMYDLVGELRFLVATLAKVTSKAHLYVGRRSRDDDTGTPIPVEPGDVADVIPFLGSFSHIQQILFRATANLQVPGECYLVGVPAHILPGEQQGEVPVTERIDPLANDDDLALDDLEWFLLSSEELTYDKTGTVTLRLPGGKIETTAEEVWIVRVWNSHPRRAIEADSPARSSLPVLRELVGLTMLVSAQVDSRLAGAGILAVAQSVATAVEESRTQTDGESTDFVDALIEAMVTPIQDRSSASSVVPFVVTVPEDGSNRAVADYFHHIKFDSPLDAQAQSLREEALRRFALGYDAPPELLLGMAAMNHWGAWLVREDVIVTHIEPTLATICDALTRQFLWPLLEDQGMPEEQREELVFWYSVKHLISRPNKGEDALQVYDKGELSGEALRRETGFSDEDAPITQETDEAVTIALQLVTNAPSLAAEPGLPSLVQQIRDVLAGRITEANQEAPGQAEEVPEPQEDPEEDTEAQGPPGTSPQDDSPANEEPA